MSVFDPKQDEAALEKLADHLVANLVAVVIPALEMSLEKVTNKLFAGYTITIKVDKHD